MRPTCGGGGGGESGNLVAFSSPGSGMILGSIHVQIFTPESTNIPMKKSEKDKCNLGKTRGCAKYEASVPIRQTGLCLCFS
jgi:hypothetical protein